MNLYHIEPGLVPAVWNEVAAMLGKALNKGQNELDLGQLRLLLVNGHAELLVGRDDTTAIQFAVAVEFQDFPNYRVAHVIAMGGRDTLQEQTFDQFRAWAKRAGCEKMQAWCGDGVARLWRRFNFEPVYHVLRGDL